jgi:hypothetical protein
MNFLIGVFLVLGLCVVASAADTENPTTKISPDDYYDGGGIDQQPVQMDSGKGRNPASGDDLPYSDDEIQKNTPENYTPQNMPIDQD